MQKSSARVCVRSSVRTSGDGKPRRFSARQMCQHLRLFARRSIHDEQGEPKELVRSIAMAAGNENCEKFSATTDARADGVYAHRTQPCSKTLSQLDVLFAEADIAVVGVDIC